MLLTVILAIPLLGAIVVALMPKHEENGCRHMGMFFSLATFATSLGLCAAFKPTEGAMQLALKIPWVKSLGISFHVGVDGISIWLVILTTFLTPIVILSAYKHIAKKVKEFVVSMLVLEVGMLGAFVALDMFLFYVFWEIMLIPMYLLIGVWGNPARRLYAAIKFVLYTIVGSLLMLVAILALYFIAGKATGTYTFDLLKLHDFPVPLQAQFWMFLAFFLAFAIKVPMFPFHTWLPDAHTEAPTVGSVVLAAVLLKMGTYGFIRFAIPLFPNAAMDAAWWICLLSVIGIIYGAWVAMVQPDVKRLVAFSSVSHLGFVMLGMFAMTIQGLQGSLIQMINHGLSTGALFLIVGMIYERRHTRLIEDFGGISKVMPIFSVFFMIFTLSSIGLPGLNGFVGEFLILLGAFKVDALRWYAIIAATGVIFAAVYMLWMFQRVMFGEITNPKNLGLSDLSPREILVLTPILVFVVWIGVYPNTFLRPMEPALKNFVQVVEKKRSTVLDREKAQKAQMESASMLASSSHTREGKD